MRLVLIGIAIGIAVAYVASGAIGQLLFEVGPTDLTIFAAVPVLLMTAGLLACYVPARRASRLDPAATLRAE
jgi:putative ABC transport system permease protein